MLNDVAPSLTEYGLLFFQPNRVWRCYTGGALLDRFLGHETPTDTHLPEEWLASCVLAVNGDHTLGPEEGLSRVRVDGMESGPLLRNIIEANPKTYLGDASQMTLLCKYLDSAVRLPIQCHPDQEFARNHYASNHGKAESWLVLGTRKIGEEEPYLLMGFKPGIRRGDFTDAVAAQDIPAMEAMLHRVPVKAGDVYFIPGRFPHAIGPGVFLLEVQEPSDWVVQPERYCAAQRLSDSDMWGPLDPETALDCFKYDGESLEQVRGRLLKVPLLVQQTNGGSLSRLIGAETTTSFGVDFLEVNGEFVLEHDAPYYLVVVISGNADVYWEGGTANVSKGDFFLVPHRLRSLSFVAAGSFLKAYICLPGA
jgi:mannose-6-phosphate isomerase